MLCCSRIKITATMLGFLFTITILYVFLLNTSSPFAGLISIRASIVAASSGSNVYIVLLNRPPVVHLFGSEELSNDSTVLSKHAYASDLVTSHDLLLQGAFTPGTYRKLYSYTHLINAFAALLSEEQASILEKAEEVLLMERDSTIQKQTTYTPSYLGLPNGAWKAEGGAINAGEGIVIGVVDTGIDPTHPSFSDETIKPYPKATHYKGSCEVATEFPRGSCNRKLVGAQHFAKAAIASGRFNTSMDFASPLDADGHGTHTASTAAGNNGLEVLVDGLSFGFASGMAPRAHIAVYKALYQGFGGFISDVVAAIEQAVKDNVDILSLSLSPSGPPAGVATYLSVFDMAMLSASRAGVFIAQAAGNKGPYPQSILSFSPWICSIAASVIDRTYPNSMVLGNNATIQGTGLASGTPGNTMYNLILATDALQEHNRTIAQNDDECQNATSFNKEMVRGKVLICSYGLNFIFGISTLNNVVDTIKTLSAVGVVMITTVDLNGISISNAPFSVPAIMVLSSNGSKAVLDYYASTHNFTATVKILGGAKARFSNQGPQVASFSSRGPDTANARFQVGDILKPNVLAPGNMIWAAWSTIGADSAEYRGQRFAMISGTSMATPHIAGIAALVKQKYPTISPAAISSALMTSAFVVDHNGQPLLAQNPSSNTTVALGLATPFDFGGGAVNATGAVDPGIVFNAEFEDYVKFLCTISGAGDVVQNTTGVACDSGLLTGQGSDLNLPSITIANLTANRIVPRKVLNIASASETYKVNIVEPKGVAITVDPIIFTIAPNSTQELSISINPTETSKSPRFGHLLLSGSNGHIAHVPVSIVNIMHTTMTSCRGKPINMIRQCSYTSLAQD